MPLTIAYEESTSQWTIDIPAEAVATTSAQDLTRAVESVAAQGGGEVDLWVHGVDDTIDAAIVDIGFLAYRDLWQLRTPLPRERSRLATRPFTVDDADDFIGVNNRAFAWHPEQGGMNRSRLDALMSEPWFNADGFRLYDQDGELAGFCWTKVHHDEDPIIGEIFVIAVDPRVHGQGLGIPMTLAGLDWLHDQGIDHGMLYVESDNDPANATYAKIGFSRYRTDRAYRQTIAPTP